MRSVRLQQITVAAVVALATLATQFGHAASTASLPGSTLIQPDGPDTGPGSWTWSIGQFDLFLIATGGDGTYTWSLVDGSLPPGISLTTDLPAFFPDRSERRPHRRRHDDGRLHVHVTGDQRRGDRRQGPDGADHFAAREEQPAVARRFRRHVLFVHADRARQRRRAHVDA